jgi:hypothetical protein
VAFLNFIETAWGESGSMTINLRYSLTSLFIREATHLEVGDAKTEGKQLFL